MIVNMHKAKTQLSKLVERARKGEEVIIAKNGAPVARIVPAAAKPRTRRAGLYEGKFKIGDDFNDPLPEGFDGLS